MKSKGRGDAKVIGGGDGGCEDEWEKIYKLEKSCRKGKNNKRSMKH